MVIVLKKSITDVEKNSLITFLKDKGYKIKEIHGQEETVLGAVGLGSLDKVEVEMRPGVSKVFPISKPYKFASREFKAQDTVFDVGPITIGGDRIISVAGPCAIESREQIFTIAELLKKSGAVILRGGAFKPRTSPYSFQGLGEEGLVYLREAGDAFGMPVMTEIVSTNDVALFDKYVDIVQIGARNMQNFELLKAVGSLGKPVLLKRGISATIQEWLMAAEYLIASGTDKIILCERGIRTYETETRNTLDLSAIPVLKRLTHLPVFVDPSHGTGRRDSVMPMTLAAVSGGAHGVVVEVHHEPENAMSDGPQSLYPEQFEKLMRDIEVLAPVVRKEVARLSTSFTEIPKVSAERTSDLVQVAFQGESGAYSEVALYRTFDKAKYVSMPCKGFKDVFDAVLSGTAEYGILPVENSLAGSVHSNYDLIIQYPDVHITAENSIRIEHSLIGSQDSSIDKIKKVYSHPQALSQSSKFLETLGDVELIPYSDTSGSVKFISQKNDPSLAAIAGEHSAVLWNMKVLKINIENNPRNYTRFVVIQRGVPKVEADTTKASLVFAVDDQPGALLEALNVFKQYDFNMKKLESRPIAGSPWQYMFYADIDIAGKTTTVDGFLQDLANKTADLRLLGCYKSKN
ncbi:MAG: 3-deoxy-7-phosphoheptulonate synthase [Spirochaetales bacterium]|nr:3-deoxy-7-phosphoheptulonate synthase [Spirochaetales bacterium]